MHIHEPTHIALINTTRGLADIIDRLSRQAPPLELQDEIAVRNARQLSDAAESQLRQAGALPYQTKSGATR